MAIFAVTKNHRWTPVHILTPVRPAAHTTPTQYSAPCGEMYIFCRSSTPATFYLKLLPSQSGSSQWVCCECICPRSLCIISQHIHMLSHPHAICPHVICPRAVQCRPHTISSHTEVRCGGLIITHSRYFSVYIQHAAPCKWFCSWLLRLDQNTYILPIL